MVVYNVLFNFPWTIVELLIFIEYQVLISVHIFSTLVEPAFACKPLIFVSSLSYDTSQIISKFNLNSHHSIWYSMGKICLCQHVFSIRRSPYIHECLTGVGCQVLVDVRSVCQL